MLAETRQTVVIVVVKVTTKPEVALALRLALAPTTIAGAAPKVIVWLPLPIRKLCVICGAALLLLSPDWSAARVQVLAVTPLTVLPDTVQLRGVMLLKLTVSPEVAVALILALAPTTTAGGAPKAML